MKIIIALNSFKNYIDSIEGCKFLKKKLNANKKLKNKFKMFPMADGGEYTAKVLNFYKKSKIIDLSTFDIFKKKINIKVVEFKSDSIFIGTSDILGARNYNIKNINPIKITSYGLGYAMKKLSKKYKNIYVGMGGTLIADAGAGAVEGFGGKFLDGNNDRIKHIIPDKFPMIKKVIRPNIFKRNNLFFLMDGKMYFKDIDIPLRNKIGSKFNNKKEIMRKQLKRNIKTYFSKISKRKIEKIKYSANAGAMWLSFYNFRNSYALNGAKFISNISGIKKYNNKKNILITGEGIFDNSLIGKGP
ncbi:glycerate kinase, partial [Candidatus Pelagibacter sp.]|nr:glycerate kinase [Candidatus Pelagibacter sp.]